MKKLKKLNQWINEQKINEAIRISLFDPNTNKIVKTLLVDKTYKEAEQEVEKLNKKLSAPQKNKGYYWKVTAINEQNFETDENELHEQYEDIKKEVEMWLEAAEDIYSEEYGISTCWTDDDAIAFSYVDGEMWVSVRGHESTHYGLSLCSGNYYARENPNMVFPGRLWEDRKVISFWKYPKPHELNKVLRDIEKKYREEVFIFDHKNGFYFDVKIENYNLYVHVNSKWLKVKQIIMVDEGLEVDYLPVISFVNETIGKIKPSNNSWYELFEPFVDKQHKMTILILESKFDLNITDDWYIDVYNESEDIYELIKISEYIGSDDRSEEELRISHTDSPQEKERKRQLLKQQGKELPKGYFKSKYNVPAKFDYMRRKYMFQEKFKLFESPDKIEDLPIRYTDHDAVTFGMFGSEMLVSFRGEKLSHARLGEHYDLYREDFYYPGRLWLEDKIISFWDYPEADELEGILKRIEDTYNNGIVYVDGKNLKEFKVKNDYLMIYSDDLNDSVVEYIYGSDGGEYYEHDIVYLVNEGEINDTIDLNDYYSDELKYGIRNTTEKLKITDDWRIEVVSKYEWEEWPVGDEYEYDSSEVTQKIIPIKDYIGSGKRSEEELRMSHTDDPQEKERKRQLLKQQGKEGPKGYFKSKYNVPAKFDYMRRKYMFQEKFSGFKKLNNNI